MGDGAGRTEAKHVERTSFASSDSLDAVPQEARGLIRDAIAALTNLEHLVRSPRVGTKPIAPLLPELRALVQPVATAVHLLLVRAALDAALADAAESLASFSSAGLSRLGDALDRAMGTTFGARERLALEAEVRVALVDLTATAALLDLLRAAASNPATELDLRDTIGQLAHSMPGGMKRDAGLHVIAALDDAPGEVHADPSVLTGLVSVAAAVVHRAGVATPVIHARAVGGAAGDAQEAQVEIAVGDGEAAGDVLVFTPAPLAPPTLGCAAAAAAAAGATFEVDEDGRRVVTRWKAR